MTTRSGSARLNLPEEHADRLRALLGTDNALLNAVLAAYRDPDKGWPAPALARALGLEPPATSKRVQRARRLSAEALDLARRYRPIRRAARAGAVAAGSVWAKLAPRVIEYERWQAAIAGMNLPKAPRIHATLDGKQLEPEIIDRLRTWQKQTSGVNGATGADEQVREISEKLAALQNELITVRGFTPYYLSRVMEVSPRAVTSRLERHGYRKPCPSVAGTSSGEYHRRKIGDPGQGARRMTRDQRERLRAAWSDYLQAVRSDDHESGPRRSPQHEALVILVRDYLDQDFTLAAMAQVVTTADRRVRYLELQAILDEARRMVPS